MLSVGNAFANVKGILSYKPGARRRTADAVLARGQPEERLQQPRRACSRAGTPTAADYMALQGNSILDICRADIDGAHGA